MPWPVDAYMIRHPMPGGKLNVWTVDDDDPAPPTLVADDRGWGPRWWGSGTQVQGPHRILFDDVKARDLRAARERAGLARTRCARTLGLNANKWVSWEKGIANPNDEDAKVLRAFMKRAKTEQELNKK